MSIPRSQAMRARKGSAKAELHKLAAIDAKECVEWPYATNRKGYGIVRWGGRSTIASKVVCEITHGPVPEGMEVAHSCGNARCCNPAHLRHATSAENKADKRLHGTNLVGERHPRAKLRLEQVKVIKASSESRGDLARKYGVSPAAIRLIVQGVNWAHV